MSLAGEDELSAISKDPQALVRIPVGAVSPLWGLFAGAAISGAAWWWMTRWARPANLEALFGAAEAVTAATPPQVEALAAPTIEAMDQATAELEPVVEAAAETFQAAVEAPTPAPIAEALIETAPEPVGGESAPISPVVAALPSEEPDSQAVAEASGEPKALAKPKKALPKPD